jgi:signal transduction histidine kinase
VDYGRNKGIRIQFDTEYEEKTIRCDPDKIERIMLNLLSNAIKFTGSGGIIKVRVLFKDKKVAISVKDTGIGIPEDKLPLIFDRFIQVDRSLSRMNEGSGIGLSIVKALVEMHGGTIGVSSRLGEGSEFIFELPDRLIDEGDKEALGFYNDQNSEYRISVEFSDIYF